MAKAKNTITKNLTFSKVVARKAEEIRASTGEKWAVMLARLVNEAYERHAGRQQPGKVLAGTTPAKSEKASKSGRPAQQRQEHSIKHDESSGTQRLGPGDRS